MIPTDFVFSQTSLQDFADCPARFDLRFVQRINTPAPESEPLEQVEAHMDRGSAFHALIHQHVIGVPEADIADTIDDDQLESWWTAYLDFGLRGLPDQRLPEITLSAPLAGHRVLAKYDLLAVARGGELVIVDWKTSMKRPTRENLLARLQTVVYRWVLVEAGAALNGGKTVQPEQIRMIYWFADFPDQPEVLPYDAAQYAADRARLTRMIEDIRTRTDFPLTDEVRRCSFCQYRGLHDRGTVAGDFRDEGGDGEDIGSAAEGMPDFTLDQIAEIAF